MSELKRRDFIKKTMITSAGLGLTLGSQASPKTEKEMGESLFQISLAEWSLNTLLFGGKMDHLNFPIDARKHGIEAIEYVNQFFKDKAKDKAYLKEMKNRADSEGVKSLLIMCDGEGALGEPAEKDRIQTVENHKKWVDAAKYLGCHSIRVNGYSPRANGSKIISFYEAMKLVADGLHRMCEYADTMGINVIIENHGGHSSYAPWLMGVMKLANHPRVGTLPDFGNFRIQHDKETDTTYSYDSYRGTKELMPVAKGVSVKTRVWDDRGNQSDLDYERMLRIVLDTGYRGHFGIEHGEKGRIWDSIDEVREKLLVARNWLSAAYK